MSDDSFIANAARLVRVTLQRVEQHHGGILLFHDIKKATARALPKILAGLKKRGYKIVQLKSKHRFKSLAKYDDRLAKISERLKRKRMQAAAGGKVVKTSTVGTNLMPFYGTIGPGKYATMQRLGPPTTLLAPAPRQRLIKVAKHKSSKSRSKRRSTR